MSRSGIYIVTLRNEVPISVNADRPSRADRCIFVNRMNCKIGRAVDLIRRQADYEKTFGRSNVNFKIIYRGQDIEIIESLILSNLHKFRIRGNSGRLNEWLEGISASEAEQIAILAIVNVLAKRPS
jgi:hypothetical protein